MSEGECVAGSRTDHPPLSSIEQLMLLYRTRRQIIKEVKREETRPDLQRSARVSGFCSVCVHGYTHVCPCGVGEHAEVSAAKGHGSLGGEHRLHQGEDVQDSTHTL